jgi:carbonic anhydrase
MDKMIEGYRRFLAKGWPARRALFQDLAEQGQNPRAMVIACADSRVDPGMIFDAAPGEIFVVRNVANLVPPYAPDGGQHATSAALEFGVRVLKVTDLVVMGHAMCGGVRALLSGHRRKRGISSRPGSAWPAPPAARCCAAQILMRRRSVANRRW